RPVPSPSMKGMMGWSGTESLPFLMEILVPAVGTAGLGLVGLDILRCFPGRTKGAAMLTQCPPPAVSPGSIRLGSHLHDQVAFSRAGDHQARGVAGVGLELFPLEQQPQIHLGLATRRQRETRRRDFELSAEARSAAARHEMRGAAFHL